jgi:hypothetical protein
MAPRMGAVLPALAGPGRLAAVFFAALAIGPTTRAGLLRTGAARRTGILRAAAFFTAAFFAAAFLGAAFFGETFLAAAFFGAAFLATAFLATAFLEVDAFFRAAFFAAFLAGFAAFFAAFLAGFFAAFFTTGLRPAIFRFAIARSPESNLRTVREPAQDIPKTRPREARDTPGWFVDRSP